MLLLLNRTNHGLNTHNHHQFNFNNSTFPHLINYIGTKSQKFKPKLNGIEVAEEESPRPQHKQPALPPTNWELVSQLNLQPRVPDANKPSLQDRHQIHQMKLLRASKYSV